MDKEHIESYYQYGVDIDNRRVFLASDIEDVPIIRAIKSIYLLDSLDDKKPLELYITSFGGDLYSLFSLYDVLNSIKCPIHTVVIGKCMSAAPLLAAVGQRGHRYAMPNSTFMMHPASSQYEYDHVSNIKVQLKHDETLDRKWTELFAKHTKMDAKFWDRLCKKQGDQYFSAEQAAEWGIIDHLWAEK